ncbi:XRE family transcriptional regulator [Staphylococcus warneri]|uniref:XRE family transcriptional regulator n=1 Tax=Staphylococcus warneri TaxID=1292 RepID=UPI001A8D05F6|nr:XRE family transcriptional regulator [Staphylococcus warneri]MBO0377753.1 XRE family transcriptional regulator [Staphylococcus warneri]MCI2790205.1 XRE family transcriptional regulator [Staphylococcus warneri]
MIIQTIERLLSSDLSAYYISQQTGVSASSIQRLRSGNRKINKLTIDTAEKLYMYQHQLDKQSHLDNNKMRE